MPPKKRDKDSDGSKVPRMDQMLIHQANHELFLQAFEKPTQIYRFMRTRNMLSPIFLNRTLSYMKQRMSRSHKGRKDFNVNKMLEKVVKKQKSMPENPGGFMTITFFGFYHQKEGPGETYEPVRVETLLMKICHKKRKDVASPMMQISMGNSEVASNPSADRPPAKVTTVSIPTENFNASGHQVKSYVLVLRATCPGSTGVLTTQPTQAAEPAAKRRKSCKQFASELTVYDKHSRSLLTDGDYDVILHEIQPGVKSSPKKRASWETVGDKQDPSALDLFSAGPMLKFRVTWANDPCKPMVDWPPPHQQRDQNKENNPFFNDFPGETAPKEQRMQVIYQFLYNNNSRQQTEACEDLNCPWCSLDCLELYSLLKHLTLCHARFSFTYVPIQLGARIDVCINELYDGSYAGSPHDLAAQPPGQAFSRNGPVRRTVATNVLVCRPPARSGVALTEFLPRDPELADAQRPGYIAGHNRLYHHTVSMMPVYPKEMDSDSEGEHDPLWLQAKTMMMIDEFTDVNEGEKELMKMWNLHVMKHGYVGDCQIPLACMMFLDARGRDLLAKNLYRNFVLHMCSLFDFGLVSPITLFNTVQRLQTLLEDTPGALGTVRDGMAAQRGNKSARRKLAAPPAAAAAREQRRKPETARRKSTLAEDAATMDPSREMMTSRSEQDISKHKNEVTLVQSAPEMTVKSILKKRRLPDKQLEATESEPLADRKSKVQWQPKVQVIYFAGDSADEVAKEEDLSDEADQLSRKAAYARGYTRIKPSEDDGSKISRTPLLDEEDIMLY